MTKIKNKKIYLQESHIKIYRFIEKYIQKKVMAPEILEIAKGAKVTDRHVYRVLDDLQTLGYISRGGFKKRSIQIIKEL